MRKLTKKKLINMVGVVLAIMITIALAVIANRPSTASDNQSYMVYEIGNPDPLMFSGTVIPSENVFVYYDPSLGTILELHVEDGNIVEEGDDLITYENEQVSHEISEYEKMRERTQTSINHTKEDIELIKNNRADLNKELSDVNDRLANLEEHSLESEPLRQQAVQLEANIQGQDENQRILERTLEGYETDLEELEASLHQANNRLQTTITAAISGVVSLDETATLNGALPLIELSSEALRVRAEVTEYDYQKLTLDEDVTVMPMTTNEQLAGTITAIDKFPISELNQSSLALYHFFVEIEGEVPYGFNVQVAVAQNALVIPEQALIKEVDEEFVFVYESDKVAKRLVTTRVEDGQLIVESGLELEALIIENPDDNLEEGLEVVINR